MRVLAIGGSGGMGRHAVSLIQTVGSVREIIVADLKESSANSFAAEMNSKVSAIAMGHGIGALAFGISRVCETVGPSDIIPIIHM